MNIGILLTPDEQQSLMANSYVSHAKSVVSLRTLEEQCCSDETLKEILDSTLTDCCRYTATVIEHEKLILQGEASGEKRVTIEETRTRVHNATMASINALARLLKKNGITCDWVPKISGNRGAYGRLAILLTFERLLNERQK